ncbi:hypothetical protein [Myceligenerans crystallogenes]|uniref:Cytochrome P450 n=1 Tax=Myceligenerans crystallogenes TaxID=316335 RepID=A0ABN2NJ18_9MICO
MSSSITLDDRDDVAGSAADAGGRGGRPLRLGDPASVPAVTGLWTAHDDVARLRDEWGDAAPVELAPGARAWLVTEYRTIVEMARGRFPLSAAAGTWSGHTGRPGAAASPLLQPLVASRRPIVGQADGTLHERLRTPIDEVFGSVDESEAARITRATCEDLAGRFAATGVADLVREYVEPIPHLTFGVVMGFDPATARQVFDAAARAGAGDASAVHEVSFLLTGQKTGPAGRLARHAAYESTAEAALGLLSLVATASQGLRAWLGQTLHLSLTDARFASRLTGGQLGIDEALDEVLWAASPVSALAPRIAAEDFLLGDKLVQQGDAVLLGVGALGSDPGLRAQGDTSGSRAHLAFGAGAHACPAPRLARLIVRTAVETLHHRLTPTLALRPEELRWTPDLRFRLLEALPVVFHPENAPEGTS